VEGLRDRFRVIVPDARGHGASAAPEGAYTLDRLGRDALALLDHAGMGVLITRVAWGEIWTRPGIDHTTRRLLTLAMLIALNREDEFRMHVRAAAEHGVDAALLKEVILQSAVYCGVPAANAAFASASVVLHDMGSKSVPDGAVYPSLLTFKRGNGPW
jgi:alkylhydroperoxidase/carboxymuconolactone decarboxylase family protein YurZ